LFVAHTSLDELCLLTIAFRTQQAAQLQRPKGILGALVDNRICSLQELIPKSRIRILQLEALSADTSFGALSDDASFGMPRIHG